MKTYEQNIKLINNNLLIDAVEGLEYLEENDQIFAGRLKDIHKEHSPNFSPEDLSPENTKEFLNSVVLQNSMILSTNLGNQKMMLSMISSSPTGQTEFKFQEKSSSIQNQEKDFSPQFLEISYSSKISSKNRVSDYQERSGSGDQFAQEAFSHMFYNYWLLTKK